MSNHHEVTYRSGTWMVSLLLFLAVSVAVSACSAADEGMDAGGEGDEMPARPAGRAGPYKAPPTMAITPTNTYTATISTPRGDIVVRLRPDVAPQTVNSFVFLARQGFYDGLTWHRVIEGFMAQGGDPTGTGTGGAGYTVPAEFSDAILFDRPGILAMARSQHPDSASSQFFITTGAAPWLNNQYTAFGEVIEGQDIVNGIPLRDPSTARQPGEQILSITIAEGN